MDAAMSKGIFVIMAVYLPDVPEVDEVGMPLAVCADKEIAEAQARLFERQYQDTYPTVQEWMDKRRSIIAELHPCGRPVPLSDEMRSAIEERIGRMPMWQGYEKCSVVEVEDLR